MLRSKVVKRKTKNKETLLRNLRKGKARLEPRCPIQNIPYPLKFVSTSQIYLLCGDIALMEHNNTILLENSLLNNFKIYKQSQVFDLQNQKLVKVLVDNKQQSPVDWKYMVDKFSNSESENLREWAAPVRRFGERYEQMVKSFEVDPALEPANQEIQKLSSLNGKADEIRKALIKTYPYFELKSQFKNGRIQLTEMLFSEKFLTELGYSVDNFTTTMLREGLPTLTPYENQCCPKIAKRRLDKFLTINKEESISPEIEGKLLMKNGYVKKVKFVSHYYPTLEKGVPGYSVFVVVVAREKPDLNSCGGIETKLNPAFIEMMSKREKDTEDFAGNYYGQTIEKTYTDIDKMCKVKKIDSKTV